MFAFLFPHAIFVPWGGYVRVGLHYIFQLFHDAKVLKNMPVNTHAAMPKHKNAHTDTHTKRARSHKSFKAQVFSEKCFG